MTTPTEHYLHQLAARRAALEAELRAAVSQARAERIPWATIGGALGLTRQAVQQRYGRRKR